MEIIIQHETQEKEIGNAQMISTTTISNYLDPDDENDGVFTEFENPDPNQDFNPNDAQDTDNMEYRLF